MCTHINSSYLIFEVRYTSNVNFYLWIIPRYIGKNRTTNLVHLTHSPALSFVSITLARTWTNVLRQSPSSTLPLSVSPTGAGNSSVFLTEIAQYFTWCQHILSVSLYKTAQKEPDIVRYWMWGLSHRTETQQEGGVSCASHPARDRLLTVSFSLTDHHSVHYSPRLPNSLIFSNRYFKNFIDPYTSMSRILLKTFPSRNTKKAY